MSFSKTFCPSPWFHMRINNSGSYEYCRWASHTESSRVNLQVNILAYQPLEFFKKGMAQIRKDMLDGNTIPGCNNCYQMEEHGKVSGRLKQLLKIGVMPEYFEKSLSSSTYTTEFDYSLANNGLTECMPQDWQIDLGNYCNSGCIMCGPESSSTLATEFKSLGIIDQLPPSSWCNDPDLVDKFISDLKLIPNIRYIHFIGGETLITPGFKRILTALVDNNLAADITVGFTTNLTVWNDGIVSLLRQFKQINLGLSIETLTPVNDYIRYPSKIENVTVTLDRWIALAKELNWLTQLRITPTCLSVQELSTVYEYAWTNNLAVESCNFIERPEFLRISVLPTEFRQTAVDNLTAWISNKEHASEQIINTRDPNVARTQIVQDAKSYINYLTSAPDESHLLPSLVNYLMRLETGRNNAITNYLPSYEKLLRAHGYSTQS